jgi:hypothetical protein
VSAAWLLVVARNKPLEHRRSDRVRHDLMRVRYRLANRLVAYFLRRRAQRAILIITKSIVTLLLHVEKVAAARGGAARQPRRRIANLTIGI